MDKIFHFILIYLSLYLSTSILAQDTLVLPMNNDISVMEIDAKGNFYVADDDFSLYKFDKSGKLITNVNIKSYGEISSIDCSNPFELYIYYQDQNIVVFYDNMLNIRGELRLNNYFYNVACIARSFDNYIWLVDMTEFKMLKINKKGDILIETPYLNNILQNEIHPFKIWENKNAVYVADSNKGVYQFDIMGTYNTTYYIQSMNKVAQKDRILYYVADENIYGYRMLTREPVKYSFKLESSANLSHFGDRLYSTFQNKIISYRAEL